MEAAAVEAIGRMGAGAAVPAALWWVARLHAMRRPPGPPRRPIPDTRIGRLWIEASRELKEATAAVLGTAVPAVAASLLGQLWVAAAAFVVLAVLLWWWPEMERRERWARVRLSLALSGRHHDAVVEVGWAASPRVVGAMRCVCGGRRVGRRVGPAGTVAAPPSGPGGGWGLEARRWTAATRLQRRWRSARAARRGRELRRVVAEARARPPTNSPSGWAKLRWRQAMQARTDRATSVLRARRHETCRTGWSRMKSRRALDDDVRWGELGFLFPGRRDGGWPLPPSPANAPAQTGRAAGWGGATAGLWGLAALGSTGAVAWPVAESLIAVLRLAGELEWAPLLVAMAALWIAGRRGIRGGRAGARRGSGWRLPLLAVIMLWLVPMTHADRWEQMDQAVGLESARPAVYLAQTAFSAAMPVVAGFTRLMLTNVQRKTSSAAKLGDTMAAVAAESERHATDIDFLTETDHERGRLGRLKGFTVHWSAGRRPGKANDETTGVAGCAIALRDEWVAGRPVEVVSEHAGGRGIIIKVQLHDFSWLYLVSIYAPATLGAIGSDRRHDLLSLSKWLRSHLQGKLRGRKAVVAGDMNSVLRAGDRASGRLNTYDRNGNSIPRLLDEYKFVDISVLSQGGLQYTTQFTRVNGVRSGTSRIDQIYASPSLVDDYPALVQSTVCVATASAIDSTHAPLLMSLPCFGPTEPAAQEGAMRLSYKGFNSKAKLAYRSLLGEPGAVATLEGISEAVAGALTSHVNGELGRDGTRDVFAEAWAEWVTLITTTLTAAMGEPRRRLITKEECVGRRVERSATEIIGLVDCAAGRGRYYRSSRPVDQQSKARINCKIGMLNKMLPADKQLHPFRGATWGSMMRWGPMLQAAARRGRAWGRKMSAQWMGKHISTQVAARRKKLFGAGLGSVIASGLQTYRVVSKISCAPDVVHALGYDCGFADQGVTCGCWPNALATDPDRMNELIRDHFHRWTRPSSVGPPGLVRSVRLPDGRVEYHTKTEDEAVRRSRLMRARLARTRAAAARRRADAAHSEASAGGAARMLESAAADSAALAAEAAALRAESEGALEQAHRPLDHARSAWWEGMEQTMTWDRWVAVLRAFDTGKAAGPSQIRIEAIRAMPRDAQLAMMQFVNAMMRTAIVPDEALAATMAPLHKKKRYPHTLDGIPPTSAGVPGTAGLKRQVGDEVAHVAPGGTTRVATVVGVTSTGQCTVRYENRKTASVAPANLETRAQGTPNVRPISLMETVTKIMSKHHAMGINEALVRYPEIMGKMQGAFIPGKGTEQPLLSLELVIEDALRSRGSRVAYTMLHDISKAYDRVPHWSQELALRRVKMPEWYIAFAREINTRGTTRVVTRHGLTDPYDIGCGVRQGEVSSPLMFILFMEPLVALLQRDECTPYYTAGGTAVHGSLFADDVWNVSSTRRGIEAKARWTVDFLNFHHMTMHAGKTHYTANLATPAPPVAVQVWQKGWAADADGLVDASIPFSPPDKVFRYLGLDFTMQGASSASFASMNSRYVQALAQLRNRQMSYAEQAYITQAVLQSRLSYCMAVVVPSLDEVNRWGKMAMDNLSRALRSKRVAREVLTASRRVGGMGGKSLRRMRDEAVITMVMTILNTPGSVVAEQLTEALHDYGDTRLYGCGINGDEKVTDTYFCDRLKLILRENDMQLLCRTQSGTRSPRRTLQQALGLPQGGQAHTALRAKGMTDMQALFVNGKWKTPSMAKAALDELEKALAKVATPGPRPARGRSRTWTLGMSSAAEAIRAELQREQVWQEAERGEAHEHAKTLGWMAGPATTQLTPTTGAIEWYVDGSLKPNAAGGPAVGWAAVSRDPGAEDPDGDPMGGMRGDDYIMGPLGVVGTDDPTITTAESLAIYEAIAASPRARSVHVFSDSKSCVTLFEGLRALTPRRWSRLPNRWVWRRTAELVAARRAAGQVIEVTWVRAHTDGDSTEAVWNDVADKRAKEAADETKPASVTLPPSERQWVLLHNGLCVGSDILRYVGKQHETESSERLRHRKWAPTDAPNADMMCVEHVVKARDGIDLQTRAVRMWARAGLRTATCLAAMNKGSALGAWMDVAAEIGTGGSCPMCGGGDDTTDHILGTCPVADEPRSEVAAEFYTGLQSHGNWGWWEAPARKADRRRRLDQAYNARRALCGGRASPTWGEDGLATATLNDRTLPRRVWMAYDRYAEPGKRPNAWLAEKAKIAEASGFWSLPPRLHRSLVASFGVGRESDACELYGGGYAARQDWWTEADPDVQAWAGQSVLAHVAGGRAVRVAKLVSGLIKQNRGTRVLLVAKGRCLTQATVDKLGGKRLCTWGARSVPIVLPKHLAKGLPSGRRYKDCSDDQVTLLYWEDGQSASSRGRPRVAAVQLAALQEIRGREGRRTVRLGDAIGEWSAPTVPKALADNVDIGFDKQSVKTMMGRCLQPDAPDWGAGPPVRLTTGISAYRALMPRGITSLLKRAEVGQDDRRRAANELAEGLVRDTWNVWRAYENKLRELMKREQLLEDEPERVRPEYVEPAACLQRQRRLAMDAALDGCFGRLAVCRRAKRKLLGEVVDGVIDEYKAGRLPVKVVGPRGGTRSFQVTPAAVLSYMQRRFIHPIADPEWRSRRKVTSTRRQRQGHRRRRAGVPLRRASGVRSWRRERTEGRQAWTAARLQGAGTFPRSRKQIPLALKDKECGEWMGKAGEVAVARQDRRDPGSQIPAAGTATWDGFTYWYTTPKTDKIGLVGTVTSWSADSAQVWVWKKQVHVTVAWREIHRQYTNQRWPKGRICRCSTCLTARETSRGSGAAEPVAGDRSRAQAAALARFNAREAEEDTDTSDVSSENESEHNKRVLEGTRIRNYWDSENTGKVGEYNEAKHEYTVVWPRGEGAHTHSATEVHKWAWRDATADTKTALAAEQLSGRYKTYRSFMTTVLTQGVAARGRQLSAREKRVITSEGGAAECGMDRHVWLRELVQGGLRVLDDCGLCLTRAALNSVFVGASFRYADAGLEHTMAITDYLPDIDWFKLQDSPPANWASVHRAQNAEGHMVSGQELRRRGGLVPGHVERVVLDLAPVILQDISEASALDGGAGRSQLPGLIFRTTAGCGCAGGRGRTDQRGMAGRYGYTGTPAVQQQGIG